MLVKCLLEFMTGTKRHGIYRMCRQKQEFQWHHRSLEQQFLNYSISKCLRLKQKILKTLICSKFCQYINTFFGGSRYFVRFFSNLDILYKSLSASISLYVALSLCLSLVLSLFLCVYLSLCLSLSISLSLKLK